MSSVSMLATKDAPYTATLALLLLGQPKRWWGSENSELPEAVRYIASVKLMYCYHKV
jgi:hypothetical protein